MASLSNSGLAHPPRSNPPLRFSSGAPFPCTTPSTETCVVVVSFMGSSLLAWRVPRYDRIAARVSSVERGVDTGGVRSGVSQLSQLQPVAVGILEDGDVAPWVLEHLGVERHAT